MNVDNYVICYKQEMPVLSVEDCNMLQAGEDTQEVPVLNVEDVWQHTQGPTSLVELAMEQKATNVALVEHHYYLCLILHSVLVLCLKSVKPLSLFDSKVLCLLLL